MEYRTNGSDPVFYDDYVSYNNEDENPGDWQRLFDDIDSNGKKWSYLLTGETNINYRKIIES